MENNVFQCQALIPDNGIKTMADKGVRVMIDTQELSPEEAAALFALKGKFGNLYFAEAPLSPEQIEIPDAAPEFKGQKSASQRLRAVLYLLWERRGRKGDFEVFYQSKMEGVINQVKDLLD